ncbi:unnamed protein product [Tilletia controversa]|nr:unnamed protein product [Tilletia controversa]CAD6977048.1 unnamed protein product [Tilletia controversa]
MIAASLRTAALPALTRCASAASRFSSSAARRAFTSSSYQLARRYSKDHEWADLEDGQSLATVGITKHAANQLGDVVFVELKSKGTSVEEGAELGTIESVKAVSELYAPLSGIIEAVNEQVVEDPSMINTSPESEGWIIKLNVTSPAEFKNLLSEEAYKAYVAEQE